ncbi:translation initiation factor eIF-2B alpha subunit [Heterostelium album PN500]|uniref:Methylthioribose-1-phosphate isomerase n=1 Tax=Heterostelium pallidum (strain ATCC 26659 / Pp 5 / PN500) TaxID=670386 RepID=D3BL61_HETP5|nr:translation initiation factor eIF-2B alpha subunit [Heterostelium album PN500]EFA77795.1 translation initiation factor eIF-2B alpha subunit [Heterostelium album PN500]|eukprot:XP_020429923.1 translation initiation factor eIF-2B alpha subunit [Heterostelium album PN500]
MEKFEYLSIRYDGKGLLEILDQRKLPDVEEWLVSAKPEDMIGYIKQLSVRGAPLIGVAACVALFLYVNNEESARAQCLTEEEVTVVATKLRDARPTAVNLMNNLDEMLQLTVKPTADFSAANLGRIARAIIDREVDMCARISVAGAELLSDGDNVLTHCNTGAIATPGMGTALGIIREAWRQGKKIHVYVDETRPLLQGGRLTTYELAREKIPHTLICDNMAATLMAQGKIQRVLVGADRIACNGDFANKIGTYSVAVLAHYHGVPFHGVAPWSTVDLLCPSGKDIPIEERQASEVQGVSGAFGNVRWAPANTPTFNPAFDVTPVELVTSHILDTGIYTQQQLKDSILTKHK